MKDKILHPWQVKLVGGGALGDTGDYDDGHWEISNGKLSLYTHDCDESDETEDYQFEALVNALNATKANFWTSDDDKAYGLELERDYYKAEVARLSKLLNDAIHTLIDISCGKASPDLLAQEHIIKYNKSIEMT